MTDGCDRPHKTEVDFGRDGVVIYAIYSEEKEQCSQRA